MQHFIRAFCFSLFCACLVGGQVSVLAQEYSSSQDQTVRFMQGLQDVPLAPGLEELVEESLSFDKPEGRIIEVRALLVSSSMERVGRYYESVLVQFGWKRIDSPKNTFHFIRNNELLSLSFESIEENKIARFMLSPVG